MKLSERLRPDVECAPWVIEEVKRLEKALEQSLIAFETDDWMKKLMASKTIRELIGEKK